MKAMRQGAAGGVMKFVIFGFLIMAVGGMVMMDVGGFFRSGGVGSTDVAKVGGEKISLPVFDRQLRRQLSQLGLGPQEAYRAGFVDQVLGSEIRNRLMAKAAYDLDIAVDNRRVAEQIKTMIGPMVGPGQDAKDVLKQLLMGQGMSEGELTRAISQEITLGLLNRTIQNGFTRAPDNLAADLYSFEQEKRDVVFVPFLEKDLESVLAPSDDQLQSLYNSTKDALYSSPETRQLKLVKLNTDALKSTIAVDEQELRDAYDDSIDLYSEKEQKKIEQAMFLTEERAKEVAEKVKSGTGLEKATASQSDYLGEKDFAIDSLPPEIKDAVIAAKQGDVIGPVKTSIGWQVVVLKKTIPAQTKSFESVRKEIRDEIVETRLIDQQYELSGMVEDMLAGGASLDDVKKEVDITITDLPAMNAYGQDKNNSDALRNHEKAKSFVLENGFALQQGETSPMTELSDGSFVAVHVDSIQPKTYKPFEEVKAEMQKKWMDDQRRYENKMAAMEMLRDIQSRKISAEDFAKEKNKSLQSRAGISRSGKPPEPFDERSWAGLFEATPGEPFILDVKGGTSIAWVTKADLPEKVNMDTAEFREFKERLAGATQQEALLMYGEDKRLEYGAVINKRLLHRAYGQAPDGGN